MKFKRLGIFDSEDSARKALYDYNGGYGYLKIHRDWQGNITEKDEVWVEVK